MLMIQTLSYGEEAKGAINPVKLASRDCNGSSVAEMTVQKDLRDEKLPSVQMCVGLLLLFALKRMLNAVDRKLIYR